MPLHRLDHFLVVAADLDCSRRFYTEVLGLVDGPRPPFDFPGHWLYADGVALVHLADATRRGGAPAGDGRTALDHVAFRASDLAGTLARLHDNGVEFDHRRLPGSGVQQVFLRDPDGVTIELDFDAGEVDAR